MNFALANLSPSPPDDRDFRYIVKSFGQEGSIREFAAGVENQLGAGACTTHAVGSACELILTRANRSLDLSFQFGYDVGRIWEARRDEPGMYLRDAFKVAHQLGIPPEAAYPYRNSEVTQEPSQVVIDWAAQRKITRYERIDTNDLFNSIRSANTENCPVVFAMNLGQKFLNIFGPLEAHNYPSIGPDNPLIGAHAMVIEGYGPDYVDIENSWGVGHGDRGFVRIGLSVLADIFEAWAIRGFAGIDPTTQVAHDWAMAHPEEVKAFALAQYPDRMQVFVDALIQFGISAPEFESFFGLPSGVVRNYSKNDGRNLDWRDFKWI